MKMTGTDLAPAGTTEFDNDGPDLDATDERGVPTDPARACSLHRVEVTTGEASVSP